MCTVYTAYTSTDFEYMATLHKIAQTWTIQFIFILMSFSIFFSIFFLCIMKKGIGVVEHIGVFVDIDIDILVYSGDSNVCEFDGHGSFCESTMAHIFACKPV